MHVFLRKILRKRIAGFLFVSLYAIAMLRPIAPFVEYAINKGYIATFLCINKDKPALKCEGKCHLFKQVKKQQQEEQKTLRVSMEEYPIGFIEFLTLPFKYIFLIKRNSFSCYKNNYS